MTGEQSESVGAEGAQGDRNGPPDGAVKRVIGYRVVVGLLVRAVLQLADRGTLELTTLTELKEALRATKRR